MSNPSYPMRSVTGVNTQFETGPITLGTILGRHKVAFLLPFIIVLGVVLLVDLSLSPVYEAQASVEIENSTPSPVKIQDAASATSDSEPPSFNAYLETQMGLLQSKTLIRRVVDRMVLESRLNSINYGGLVLLRKRMLHSNRGYTREAAYELAEHNLNVRMARLSNLIEVVFASADPKISADFVNTLLSEYSRMSLDTRWETSQNVENWLSRELTSLRAKLEASERALQVYSQRNNLTTTADNGNLSLERLQQIQTALSQAEGERMQRQSRLVPAQSDSATIPQLEEDTSYKTYVAKLADLRRQLAEYGQVYTPTYTKTRMLTAQISELELTISKEREVVVRRLEKEYDIALAQQQLVQAEYDRQSKVLRSENEKMIGFNTLKHEADTNRAIYYSVLQRAKESGVSAALQATNARVVDAALPPRRPTRPNHLVNLAGGLLGALVISACSVLLQYRRDSKLLQLPGYLGVRQLGAVPALSRADRQHSVTSGSREFDNSVRPLAQPFALRPQTDVKSWLNPDSGLSESFRGIMTSLVFIKESRPATDIILITSPCAGEGKTTIVSNLGAVIARTGRKVLLVDADIRRPRLHELFNVPVSPGLVDLACDDAADITQKDIRARAHFAQPTSIANLSILPSGRSSTADFQKLHSLRLLNLLASLRPAYNLILLDAPPLLEFPEARLLAGAVDGVVLVLRAGSTSISDAMAAERQLEQDGSRLLGTVLNDVPKNVSNYGKASYYYIKTASAV